MIARPLKSGAACRAPSKNGRARSILQCHEHDDRYFTQEEINARFGNTGDFTLDESYWPEATEGRRPPEEFLQHLKKLNPNQVIIDYPQNITASGLDHAEVIQAAIYWLDHGDYAQRDYENSLLPPDHEDYSPIDGFWIRGEIIMQAGYYECKNEIICPGRLNIRSVGGGNMRDAGCTFRAQNGGNLETGFIDAYVLKMIAPNGIQWDSSFFANCSDISIDCNNICSGMEWGGAQCSALRRIQIRRFPNGTLENPGVGIKVLFGSNGLGLENVWSDGSENGDSNVGFLIDDYVFGLTMVACKAEGCGTGVLLEGTTGVVISGFYNENCWTPLRVEANAGTTLICNSFDSKLVKNRDGLGRAIIMRVSGNYDGPSISMRGRVRDIGDWDGDSYGINVDVGYIDNRGYHNVSYDVSDDKFKSFEIDLRKSYWETPKDIGVSTLVKQGRSYLEEVTTATHSFSFDKNNEDLPTAELWLHVDVPTSTITIPESVLLNTETPITSVVLSEGFHKLRWRKVFNTWLLDLD